MSFLGGVWTPNIIWYLSGGPRRFTELKDDLKTIAPKVLSDKLKKMEMDGIVERKIQVTSPPTVEYSLTPLGEEFLPILRSIAQLGNKLKRQGRVAESTINK